MSNLADKKCMPGGGDADPLSPEQIKSLLQKIDGWKYTDDGPWLKKTFKFQNYYKTMAFVNAVAWIANQENHHPGLEVSYSSCAIRFQTHDVGGLSENDFICASKIDALGAE